jgi:hypothetical protein
MVWKRRFDYGRFASANAPHYYIDIWLSNFCILADLQKGRVRTRAEFPDAHTVCESRYLSLAGLFRLAGAKKIKGAARRSSACLMTFLAM